MDPFGFHYLEHRVEPSKVTDHIIPHHSRRDLFRDPANFGALCVSCHNHKTFLESRGETVTYLQISTAEIQERALLGRTLEIA
jgi:5-methylcytosine-specific restriction endonuclease McrA